MSLATPTDSRGPAAGRRPRPCRPGRPEVVEVHRLGQQQVAVGIEPPDQLVALVLQVALDLEPLPQREALDRLDDLLEPLAEHVVAAERHHRHHPGRPGLVGAPRRAGRRSTPPRHRGSMRIARRPLPPADLGGAGGRGRGDRHQRPYPLGVHHAPLQRLHSPHRPADDTSAQRATPRWSATAAWVRTMSRIDHREVSPGPAVVGMGEAGPVEPGTAQHVDAHHEPAVRVQRPAGADDVVPPPGRGCPVPSPPAAWLSPVRAWHTSTAFDGPVPARPRSRRRRSRPGAVPAPPGRRAARPGRRGTGDGRADRRRHAPVTGRALG